MIGQCNNDEVSNTVAVAVVLFELQTRRDTDFMTLH